MPPKILKSAAEIVKDAIKAVEAEKKAGKTGEILESRTAPATTPRGGTLLPRSQGMYPPDVPQVDLPRQKGVDKARAEGKKPKYTERMQSLLDSPTVRKKVDKLIAKGQDLGMQEWYGTEPLRQVALDVISPQQYESLMAQLASASQRNPVDQQNLMGSYLYYLQQQGKLDPEAVLLTNKLKEQGLEGISAPLIEFPEGYGSLAQSAIFERGKQIASGDIAGALPPEKKLGTFYRNLLGNLQPVTVDVNAVRGPVIEAGDPRWLTSKLVEKDEAGKVKNVYFPRQMVEEGEMSIREAKQRPGFWEAAPSGSEYAGFEDLWQRAARREGVAPAEAQALGWYGSADVTALKTKPELYVDNLERLLNRTAEVTGKSPLEVLRQFLKGEEFLKKAKGGSIDLEAEYRMGKGGLLKKAVKAVKDAIQPTAPQDEALRIAQKNAAKPVSEGGLGLPPDNTPMDRAKAMGYGDPIYRGYQFGTGRNKATFYSSSPDLASAYAVRDPGFQYEVLSASGDRHLFGSLDEAKIAQQDVGGKIKKLKEAPTVQKNVMRSPKPLVIDAEGSNWNFIRNPFAPPENFENLQRRLNSVSKNLVINGKPYTVNQQKADILRDEYFNVYTDTNLLAELAKKRGYDSITIKNLFDVPLSAAGTDKDVKSLLSDVSISLKPENVRSRFAAFDPARIDESDLLAGFAALGITAPMLTSEEPEYRSGGAVMMADGGGLEEEYNLRKMGMDPTRVRGGYERKPISRKEIQAMMLDVASGVGVPFAEAGSYALRGKTDEAKESAAIEAALIGVPGAAVLAKPAYRAVKKGVQKAAPAARDLAREFLESGMESGLVQGPSYAVKPTGGQWLGGYKGDPRQIDVRSRDASVSEESAVKRREIADASKQAYAEEPTETNRRLMETSEAMAQQYERGVAVNRWIDSNLNNYVRKQMGTPDDPVLKLAEQGILHMPYQETGLLRGLAAQREKAGFPAEGLATTDLGRMWETMSDRNIASIEAGKLTDPNYLKDLERRAKENDPLFNARPGRINDEPPPAVMTPEEARDLQRFKYMNYPPARANAMEENQWLSRVDPETPIYSLSDPFGGRVSGGDLGFDHIVDVLKADLAAGRIRPEQLSKMSMEQAVRRTHEYDLERAAAMAKAAEEEMAGLSVSKTFDDGFKIVQLDKPGQFAKESDRMGHSVRGYEPPRQSEDWTEASGVEGSQFYGHGGWDAIKSGEAQVFSIRDAKNQPHVTIEVAKPRPTFAEMKGMLEGSGYDENEVIEQLFKRGYLDKSGNPVPDKPMRITQIKGKQNRKPDDDYLPYVQQFIREGNYVIAGDIRNSGLIDIDTARSWDHGFPDKYVSLRDALPANAPRYVTESELDHVRKTGKFEPKFKEGGAVQKYGKGGVVKSLIKKASEALGEHEGKSLLVTQSDRTKVGGKFLGGPGFSSLQLTDPFYKEAEAVWGVGKKGAATKMINAAQRLPEGKAIWSTMIGSPEQHKSNQQVFDELLRKFRSSAKEGNLDPDLRERINAKLASAVDGEGKPLFPENVDIMSPKFRQIANTFDRRAIAADAMGGVQLGGKKGQIIDYSKIIESTTDPLLIDQPTHAIGPRLFQLQGDIIERPDLHPAYPFILTGEDLATEFVPVPRDIMLRDFVEGIRQSKGREPGFMDLTRNTPSQFLSEEFLTGLQKSGFKKGGPVKKGALPTKRA